MRRPTRYPENLAVRLRRGTTAALAKRSGEAASVAAREAIEEWLAARGIDVTADAGRDAACVISNPKDAP